MACIAYWLIGFPFAFGSTKDHYNPFIGTMYWAHSGFEHATNQGYYDYNIYAFWFFQMTFAATCATIVSGSLAERCDFNAYLIYSFFLTGLFVKHFIFTFFPLMFLCRVGSRNYCKGGGVQLQVRQVCDKLTSKGVSHI